MSYLFNDLFYWVIFMQYLYLFRYNLAMIDIIEKIEGEAKLNFSFVNDKIDFVDIEFFSSRGIEQILIDKNPLDALVINPRVCGICGHAHLITTVKALEDCYDHIQISNKARIVRELTLNFELIQNHFKWFYLTIFPLLGLNQELSKAIKPSQSMGKAIAALAGQYPHNSYAIPGGITSKVLSTDLIKAENFIDETIRLCEENLISIKIDEFINKLSVKSLFNQNDDLSKVLTLIKKNALQHVGKSFDRFLVVGDSACFQAGRWLKTNRTATINKRYIKEYENPTSCAKDVLYRDKYYEVGPLSRAMINKTPLIKDSHRHFGDSIVSRILARVYEIPYLLFHSKRLLKQIDLSEPSFIKPLVNINELDSSGFGVVEAARGSLIHNVLIKKGKIEDYQIITPTQWNLSNGTRQNPGIAQKAMKGLENKQLAELAFKSFDVCSVCTTQ